jgi:transposase-like protein
VEYTDTIKARMVRRMVGPRATTATALAMETGIAQSTLSRWLRRASTLTVQMKEDPKVSAGEAGPRPRRPQDWTAAEKLRAVSETSGLQGEELGEYLRRHGLHAETLEQWRVDAIAALERPTSRRRSSAESKRIKELERELRKKEKALAETAALLVLRKKANALWGDGDDDTDDKSEP